MGDKHAPLTIEEVNAVRFRRELDWALEGLCRSGRSPTEIRVLDLGCGRGATTLKLLQKGFDAYGVDVDSATISKGAAVFAAQGFAIAERLKIGDGRLPFDRGMFDLILSEQVLEHVRDLRGVVVELSRVTKAGGLGLHYFPAKWVAVEPHVFVHCVHWLPKNRLRYWWLKWQTHHLPDWNGHDLLTPNQRLETFYAYLQEKTYYRSNTEIGKIFNEAEFQVVFQASRPLTGTAHGISKLTRLIGDWRDRTFDQVILQTRKVGPMVYPSS